MERPYNIILMPSLLCLEQAATLNEIIQNPGLLLFPKSLDAHLENYFPSLVILHGETGAGKFKQIHFFIPESKTHTRTYVLMYGLAKHPIFLSKHGGMAAGVVSLIGLTLT